MELNFLKQIKQDFKILVKDRAMFAAVVAVFLAGSWFFWWMISNVQYFDRLIFSRYTVFGGERLHRDAWFYRVFVAFLGVVISVFHSIVITKILRISGRRAAGFFAIMSLIVVILARIILGIAMEQIKN